MSVQKKANFTLLGLEKSNYLMHDVNNLAPRPTYSQNIHGISNFTALKEQKSFRKVSLLGQTNGEFFLTRSREEQKCIHNLK